MKTTVRHESRRIAIATYLILLCLFASSGSALAMTAANTTITNTAHATWQDAGAHDFNVNSNTVTVTVQPVYMAAFSTPANQSGVTGTTVYYYVTLTNTGNALNGYDLTVSTTDTLAQTWTTTMYHDVAPVGSYQAGTDTVTTTTGQDAIAQNDVYNVVVAVTIPAGTANTTVGTTTLSAAGNQHATIPAATSVSFTTTAQTPVLSVEKAVKNITTPDPGYSTITNAKPNDVLEYRIKITNTGNAVANRVILTDTLNANLDFDTATYNGFYIGPDSSASNGGTGANGKGGTGNFLSSPGSGDDAYTCSGDVCGKANISGAAITVNIGTGAADGTGATDGGSLAKDAVVYVYFRGKVK